MAYTAEQVLLLSCHENDVVKRITGTLTTENTVPTIALNNDNYAALTNLNKRPYKAPNRHLGTNYTWLLEFVPNDEIRVE